MKKYLINMLLLALVWHLPASVEAQSNGDFETQRSIPPQGQDNVTGTYQAYDDLPGWQAVTNPAGPGAGTANYMATNATSPLINPQVSPYGYGGATFMPHSGRGCVVIQREAYGYTRDQFITQQVPLLPNHTYQANFYVLRNPGAFSYEQLLFAVSSSAPTGFSAGNFNNQYQNLTPAPYASFTSNPITSTLTWELVTGTFISRGSSSYITIGYGPTFGQLDPSGSRLLTYAIDDVSLVDLGCAPVPAIEAEQTYYNACKLTAEYTITNYDPSLTYSITVGSGLGPLTSLSGSRIFCKGRPNTPNGYFTLTATNSCGQSTSEDYIVDWEECTGGGVPTPTFTTGQPSTTAYPNPATESLILPEGVEQGVLTNSQGNVVQQVNKTGKVDVHQLPEGLYNLQMVQNGKLINQRIQVKH